MTLAEAAGELRQMRDSLLKFTEHPDVRDVETTIASVEKAIEEVGRAWSGSWIGYQSRVYHENLQPAPPGAHFSSEWGGITTFSGSRHSGNWQEFDFDFVRSEILRRAGAADLKAVEALGRRTFDTFESAKADVLSIFQSLDLSSSDGFVAKQAERTEALKVNSSAKVLRAMAPSRIASRDSLAVSQGIQSPPHLAVLAEVASVRLALSQIDELAKIALAASSHLDRVSKKASRAERIGTNVFIGHGRSKLWKDLKDFIEGRLRLPWDEFSRVPAAGITNIARLSDMLDSAAIAFLVMTAEDEQADGRVHARLNVVHEAGLFQGRLGFTRALIMLEEGCEAFSNVHGLGQIRFPAGNIKAAFEEVREILEREGVLET